MEEIHYELLDLVEDHRNGDPEDWISEYEIKESLNYEEEEIDEAIEYLRGNYIGEIDSNYRISVDGMEVILNKDLRDSTKQLDSSIKTLKNYQERSSSVETIFTLSILFFTFIQATDFNLPKTYGAIMLLISSSWALIIGGSSLSSVTKRSISDYVTPLNRNILHSNFTKRDLTLSALFLLGTLVGIFSGIGLISFLRYIHIV